MRLNTDKTAREHTRPEGGRASSPIPRKRAASTPEKICWWDDLPRGWRKLVVASAEFNIFREYEVAAQRIIGYEAEREPCYCASRYALTQVRSDEDDVFYEETVHAETLTAWRLRDDRWLIHRSITAIGTDGLSTSHSFFSFSDSMPR